jgi:carboxypeptidase C (cathepsin A)
MTKHLTVLAAAACLFFASPYRLAAQAPDKDKDKDKDAKASDSKDKCDAPATKEESSTTDHTIRIGGQTIPYKATASTTLLNNDKGDPTGLLYSVAYTRSDVKDPSLRPVSFLYNGGPGSATMWLHMGAFGPRRAHTVDGVFTPPAPYKLVDNTESLLDKSDLVFIDAMGTGYSHAVCKAQEKDFYGVDEDVQAFAQFIVTYLSRNDRWNSPKFLIGESYGTFRSAALGNYVQNDFLGAGSGNPFIHAGRRSAVRLLLAELRGGGVVSQSFEGAARRSSGFHRGSAQIRAGRVRRGALQGCGTFRGGKSGCSEKTFLLHRAQRRLFD